MADLALRECNDGGEIIKKGEDFWLVEGWGNMVYIALFGGNPGYITKSYQPTEQAFDFWGNNTLMRNNQSIQFNSYTENALKITPLNSAGRVTIQQAVEKDLAFMRDFANLKITVAIIGPFKVKITIQVLQPPNLNGRIPDQFRAFVFVWDGTADMLLGDFSLDDFSDDFF